MDYQNFITIESKYFKLFDNVLEDTKDTLAAMIFGKIIYEALSQGTTQPIKSQISLAKELKVNKKTVSKKIHVLENLGYLTHQIEYIKKMKQDPIIEDRFYMDCEISTKFILNSKAIEYLG